MINKVNITYQDGIVYVDASGDDSYEISLAMWKKIVKTCRLHNCYNILGKENRQPIDTITAFDHRKIFSEAGITIKYRIAWVVENPEALEMVRFVETVLKNRGMGSGAVFTDVSEAKNWLLENRQS